MSAELAVIDHTQALALDAEQTYWTPAQEATLRQLGLDKATDGDLAVYHHVCQRTGLDPFARQIHMIGRNSREQIGGEWQWTTKFTIQTGIDGFRLIARRASDRLNETLELEDTLWCGPDGVWADVWTSQAPPVAAKVVVLRHGKRFPGVANYKEYVQTKQDGTANSMWAKMPVNQLAKCAEALALRRAFPQDLSGIYTDDEMGQADRAARHEAPANTASAADRMRAALADEPPQTSGPDGAPVAPPLPSDPEPYRGDPNPAEIQSLLLNTRSALAKAMYAGIKESGIEEAERIDWIGHVIGRDITSTKEMTEDEAREVLRVLDERKAAQTGGE